MSRLVCLNLLLLFLVGGCDASPRSKVQVFKNAQKNAITPHGKIDLDAVQETPDGQITYKTTDGSRWKVSVDFTADGEPRFGQPTRQVE